MTGEKKASGPRLELLAGESFALFLPVCLTPVECCLCVFMCGGMLAQAGDSENQVTPKTCWCVRGRGSWSCTLRNLLKEMRSEGGKEETASLPRDLLRGVPVGSLAQLGNDAYRR